MSALDQIEKLALIIAKEAQAEDIKLEQKIDAIKSLAPYYTILAKTRAETDDAAGSLDEIASQIHEASEDGRAIQTRTRKRHSYSAPTIDR